MESILPHPYLTVLIVLFSQSAFATILLTVLALLAVSIYGIADLGLCLILLGDITLRCDRFQNGCKLVTFQTVSSRSIEVIKNFHLAFPALW